MPYGPGRRYQVLTFLLRMPEKDRTLMVIRFTRNLVPCFKGFVQRVDAPVTSCCQADESRGTISAPPPTAWTMTKANGRRWVLFRIHGHSWFMMRFWTQTADCTIG